MKRINTLWACIAICCMGTASCFAQQDTKDRALAERIARIYHLIPGDLTAEELLRKVDEADKQVNRTIDSLPEGELKRKARLIRFNGLLWSMNQPDQTVKSKLEKRIQGQDPDSPDLELLSDVEVTNLLNGYFRAFLPDLSETARATIHQGYILFKFVFLRNTGNSHVFKRPKAITYRSR